MLSNFKTSWFEGMREREKKGKKNLISGNKITPKFNVILFKKKMSACIQTISESTSLKVVS